MKIYNTIDHKKEEFTPVNPGKVGIYVCGPTVYDYIHIGNARPMIVFDTLRRYLEYKGYDVNYVSNFTDVDDKIIKRANEEGVTSSEISEKYIAECKKDMNEMNVRPATVHPQATKEIPDMIEMIQELIDKGYAYEKNHTVYFRVRNFKDYGKLSGKNIDDLESGHRADDHKLKVSGEDEKEQVHDGQMFTIHTTRPHVKRKFRNNQNTFGSREVKQKLVAHFVQTVSRASPHHFAGSPRRRRKHPTTGRNQSGAPRNFVPRRAS